MKNLIFGLIGLIGGLAIGYFAFRHSSCQCPAQPHPFVDDKSAPVRNINNVSPSISSYRTAYPNSTKIVVHSIESMRLLVDDFDSLIRNNILIPQDTLSWALGIYPFVDTSNARKKVSYYFIPTLVHKNGGFPGNSEHPEIFDTIMDYYTCSKDSRYYAQPVGGSKGFISVYDLGNVYP